MQRVLSFPTQSNRRFGDPSEFVSKRMCFSFMFSIAFLAILAGFLLGRFVFDQELELSKAKLRKLTQEQIIPKLVPKHNVTTLLSQVSEESLGQHLRALREDTDESRNLREARLILAHLENAGFDLVSPLSDSQINLSFPSSSRPNQVTLVDGTEEKLRLNDSRRGTSEDGYLSSATAEVSRSILLQGNIIYVNFGRDEDYHHLDSLGLTVKDSIALVRVGGAPTADLVANALEHEAVGVLLFRDPQQKDVRDEFLTPADLAKINSLNGDAVPVLCISSRDAERLLGEMTTVELSSEGWRGELNSSYPIGPGFSSSDRKVVMRVNTVTVSAEFYDVFGAIRGRREPDRFVMIVHERKPNLEGEESAAIVMEMIRILGAMKAKDWSPHRSVVFASWGSNPRSHSRTKEWWSQLKTRAVAYLKIESGLLGNDSISSRGTPILEKAFVEATSASSLRNPTMDVMLRSGTESNLVENGVPFLELIQTERYGESRMKEVTSFWSALTWQLSENSGLPFSLDPYLRFFNHSMQVIEERFKMITQTQSLFLESFFEATRDLIQAISSFQSKWESGTDKSKFLDARIMNDQFLRFSHALGCRKEKSGYKISFRHDIFSRSARGNDPRAGFGLLQDLLRETTSAEAPDDLQQQIVNHLADLVECLKAGRDALSDGLDNFVRGE